MPYNVVFMSEQYLSVLINMETQLTSKLIIIVYKSFYVLLFIEYHDSFLYHTQFPVDEEYYQTSLDVSLILTPGLSHVPQVQGFLGTLINIHVTQSWIFFKLIGQVKCLFIKKCICSRICPNFLSVFYGIKVVEQQLIFSYPQPLELAHLPKGT